MNAFCERKNTLLLLSLPVRRLVTCVNHDNLSVNLREISFFLDCETSATWSPVCDNKKYGSRVDDHKLTFSGATTGLFRKVGSTAQT